MLGIREVIAIQDGMHEHLGIVLIIFSLGMVFNSIGFSSLSSRMAKQAEEARRVLNENAAFRRLFKTH